MQAIYQQYRWTKTSILARYTDAVLLTGKVSYCIWHGCTRRTANHHPSVSRNVTTYNTCSEGNFGTTIHIPTTNQTFTIKQRLTCKTSNVVYCVTCTNCNDEYISETMQELHNHSVVHLSGIRTCKPGISYVDLFDRVHLPARKSFACQCEPYLLQQWKIRSDNVIRHVSNYASMQGML